MKPRNLTGGSLNALRLSNSGQPVSPTRRARWHKGLSRNNDFVAWAGARTEYGELNRSDPAIQSKLTRQCELAAESLLRGFYLPALAQPPHAQCCRYRFHDRLGKARLE
ncbi:MAG: hypothetical protein BWX68_00036 [Verrucomicrobia bacterium ADurb.Bin063]|nr:MAG: hypothetical protein BWX68_00036 [Verrucomicrobia bacterium ADurb.Bin063]